MVAMSVVGVGPSGGLHEGRQALRSCPPLALSVGKVEIWEIGGKVGRGHDIQQERGEERHENVRDVTVPQFILGEEAGASWVL